ncbi:MAG: DUF1080 domain-containing protein [Acidobacteria bacterium]|nr:MAG: DUF1080 domain-containing protein [Acidobacteriota bacterium]
MQGGGALLRLAKERATMMANTTLALLTVLLWAAGGGQAAGQAPGAPPGFVSIFNGKDLSGWDGDPKLWAVKDGAIVGQTSSESPIGDNTFLIWTAGTVQDFELRVRFRLTNHNSGIQYRSRDLGLAAGKRENWTVGGYQADMDEANRYTGILYEERGRGIIANVGQKVTVKAGGEKAAEQAVDPQSVRAAITTGAWNDYVIVCRGNRITHRINGLITADVTDEENDKRALEGILAFQLHKGPAMKVEFKEILLKAQ